MVNREGVVGAGEKPDDAVCGLKPGDRGCGITIEIIDRSADGEGLSNFWSALDHEGGIPVIDVGDGAGIGVDGFVESLAIGVVDNRSDPLPLQGVVNGEDAA